MKGLSINGIMRIEGLFVTFNLHFSIVYVGCGIQGAPASMAMACLEIAPY